MLQSAAKRVQACVACERKFDRVNAAKLEKL
jgi:hypothetical protein